MNANGGPGGPNGPQSPQDLGENGPRDASTSGPGPLPTTAGPVTMAPWGPPPDMLPPQGSRAHAAPPQMPTPPRGTTPPPIAPQPITRPAQPASWPRSSWANPRDVHASARTLIAIAVVGVVGATVWNPFAVSIGYLLAGAAVFIAAFGSAGRRPTLQESGYIAITLALLAVPAIRDASWLAALCIAAAWVTGWLACTGGRSFTGLALGAFVAWFLPIRVTRWVWRGGNRLARRDAALSRTTPRTVGVIALTVLIVVIFAALFAGADRTFARLITSLIPSIELATLVPWIATFVLAAGFAVGTCYVLQVSPDFDRLAPKSARPVRRWEWVLPIAALDLVFATFVAVQIAVLFGGSDHVMETEGLTYAEYARQGFWQLLMVSALTVLVLAVAARTANYDTRSDRTIVRTFGGLLCALAIVVVASAIHRMWVYEQAYGFTALRMLVMATEFWLAAVFVMVLIAGISLRRDARWLPQSVLVAGALTFLALAALNPDRFAAERNIDNFAESGRIDLHYLDDLSADAVPALLRLAPDDRNCVLDKVYGLSEESWTEYNYGRAQARELIGASPGVLGECDYGRYYSN